MAVVLDMLLGDPPNRYHPVAWMGALIRLLRRWAPSRGRWAPLMYGTGLVVAGTALVVVAGVVLHRVLLLLPWTVRWLAEAYVLQLTFSLRGLVRAARQVQDALEAGDLTQARHLVSWHLVSRDTSQLGASHVAAAAIESVAENTSDGVLAPLLYYAMGGLPAALAYRFINTADAMLGYKDPVHLWLGKAAARCDDLVNLLPARLTALSMVLAAWGHGENLRRAWVVWRRDAHLTASPNAGQPMSAMAGALGVALEKIGHYHLGADQPSPAAQDIARAVRLVYSTTALSVGILIGVMLILAV